MLFSFYGVVIRKNKLGIGVVTVLGIVIVTSFTLFIGFLNNINPILADRLTLLFTDKDQSERSIFFKDAFDDFMQYPVTGKHFLLSHGLGVGYYPHNFIIEAFMAMGAVGGVFFLYLIFRSLKICVKFLKKKLFLFMDCIALSSVFYFRTCFRITMGIAGFLDINDIIV